MKNLLICFLLTIAFFSCEKNELTTLDDLGSGAVIWQLESYTSSAGGPPQTRFFESERTLRFWEGRLQSNGRFCNLTGPVGELEEIDYDPVNRQFTFNSCYVGREEETTTLNYRVNLEAGRLTVFLTACVEGCYYGYRRLERN